MIQPHTLLSLFIPESIGSYFLRTTYRASVTIDTGSIRVAIIKISGKKRIIEQLLEESIEVEPSQDYQDRLRDALQKILLNIPQGAQISYVFSSNAVVYKEITVPRMSLTKIRLIAPFEVEASLPFIRTEAYIDSIITQEHPQTATSTVLVAAAQRGTVLEHKELFSGLNVELSQITTNVISLYALLDLVKFTHEQPVFILAIDVHTTIILLKHNDSVSLLRVIPEGTAACTSTQAYEIFAAKIIATMQAGSTKAALGDEHVWSFIVCGAGADHPEICETITHKLNGHCELIAISKLLHSGTITSNVPLANRFMLPIAAALPLEQTQGFDLDQDAAHSKAENAIIRTLKCASIFAFALVGVYMTTRIIALQNLSRKIANLEQDSIATLKKETAFTKISAQKGIAAAIREAEQIIQKESSLWNALIGKERGAVIVVLHELSSCIDRKEIGLNLNSLEISTIGQKVTLDGSVPDYPSLEKLEKTLQKSLILRRVPHNLQETRFTAEFSFDLTNEGKQ